MEAAWVISNATKNCDTAQMEKLLENEVLECLLFLLDSQNVDIVEVSLRAIENILNHGAEVANKNGGGNKFVTRLENKGGVSKIENLQSTESAVIYDLTIKLLEKFF